jgi:hypothetical protein
MYKTYTTLARNIMVLVISAISISSKAQTMVDTGKVWNVVECFWGNCGTIIYSFDGDTTINLTQYQKLNVVYFMTPGWAPFYPDAAREDTTARQVFIYDPNVGEFLAYDFSLNKGDTFTLSAGNCPPYQLVVDSVDVVTLLNGETRKRMLLNGGADIWIEGIGSIYGLDYRIWYCVTDFYPTLNCFTENNTLKYQDPFFNGCFYNTSVPELSDQIAYRIQPHPFAESATITFSNSILPGSVMKIFNVSGQLVEVITANGSEVVIKRKIMKTGMHFFQLLHNDKVLTKGKFIIE